VPYSAKYKQVKIRGATGGLDDIESFSLPPEKRSRRQRNEQRAGTGVPYSREQSVGWVSGGDGGLEDIVPAALNLRRDNVGIGTNKRIKIETSGGWEDPLSVAMREPEMESLESPPRWKTRSS
jgi:hypothetical protein